MNTTTADVSASRPRIFVLDIARVAALLAMAVFHFVFDLEIFGYIALGTTGSGFWRGLAIASAGSFVFLAGVGLWLSHANGIRWAAFAKRLAIILSAAALVSVATYIAFPDSFVFFGILHSIALCSLLGLAVLRLPIVIIALLAVAVFFAPDFAASPAFNAPWLWWTGLQTIQLSTVDYEPIFPWFAAFLAGMAVAKLASRTGYWEQFSTTKTSRTMRVFGFFGRHTLVVYLIHQPILISIVWAATQVLR
ncbi:heparan-alpha-glucosaminide N-acetyltransferase [Gymnodinialimonas sp. 57CJ19]|uniref:heparan-alpha-glucosaminide N-acetyltransferase n=1 Tax=Gymnodinialimonas sp. 57CJ19 TaxID=3138498 RepID=UPI0031345956